MSPQLDSISTAARAFGVSPDTIRNRVKRGYIRAYTRQGTRGLLINVREAEQELERQPRARVRRGYGSYGPDARILYRAEGRV